MHVYDVDSKSFRRKFDAIERARPKAVVRAIASAVLLGAEIIARNAPKDTKELARSVRGVPTAGGGYVVVDAPHAGIVERGSRPHWAPLAPLVAWAKRHGAATDDEAYRFAKAIQFKIARQGTAPTYFMRRSLPALRKIFKAEVERELAKDKEG